MAPMEMPVTNFAEYISDFVTVVPSENRVTITLTLVMFLIYIIKTKTSLLTPMIAALSVKITCMYCLMVSHHSNDTLSAS